MLSVDDDTSYRLYGETGRVYMRALCQFKSVSNVQVLFVFRQISGALASEQIASKASVRLTCTIEQTILNARHDRLWNQEGT